MTQTTRLRVTVLTALPIEATAMLDQLTAIEAPVFEGDTVTTTGHLIYGDSACRLTVIELGPGNIETAIEAGRIRSDGSADLLLFVGIAGALKDLALGDVVAASEVVWTHRAKFEDGERHDRPQLHSCTRELVQVARYTARQTDWHQHLPDQERAARPKAMVGQVLSGEELVKDKVYRKELIKRFSDGRAIENEGYAVARAGSALKVLVIRGASDFADEAKDDEDQPRAARAAAAFAVQFLRDYMALLLTRGPGPRAAKPEQTEDFGTGASATTQYDHAAMAVESLLTDVDLVADDEEAVSALAKSDYRPDDHPFNIALVELLAEEVDDKTDDLLARRLRAYGRTVVLQLRNENVAVDWDGLLKKAPTGMAVLLAQPRVLPALQEVERRRVISGLIGTAAAPRAATATGWRYLLELRRDDAMPLEEAERVGQAFLDAAYGTLSDAGATLAELTPKLLKDLASGDFNAQNAAARHLIRIDADDLQDASLTSDVRADLARHLVRAADLGAWGAQEATSRARISQWDVPTLAAVLWDAMTRGRDRLDTPLDRVKDVLAACTMANVLQDVFAQIIDSGQAASLAPVRADTAEEDRDWLRRHGAKLPAPTPKLWDEFLDELYKAIPRKHPAD